MSVFCFCGLAAPLFSQSYRPARPPVYAPVWRQYVQAVQADSLLWRRSPFSLMGFNRNDPGLAEDLALAAGDFDVKAISAEDAELEAVALKGLIQAVSDQLRQDIKDSKASADTAHRLRAVLKLSEKDLSLAQRLEIERDIRKALDQVSAKAEQDLKALGSLPQDEGDVPAQPPRIVMAQNPQTSSQPSLPDTAKERFQRVIGRILKEHTGTVLGEKGGYSGYTGRYFYRKDENTGREFHFILYFQKGNPNSSIKFVEIQESLRGGEEVVRWQFSAYQDGKLTGRHIGPRDGAGEMVLAHQMSPRDKAEAYSLLAGWVNSLLAVQSR